MKINPNRPQYAIGCNSEYGPVFGKGSDIFIANNANTTTDSYSLLGFSFRHPQYDAYTNEASTFFAGSFSFKLDEIEVHKKD